MRSLPSLPREQECLIKDLIKPLESRKRTVMPLYRSFQTIRNHVALGNTWKENFKCNNETFYRDFLLKYISPFLLPLIYYVLRRFCLKLNKNQKRHKVLFREWLYGQNEDNYKIWRCLYWFFMVNKNVYWCLYKQKRKKGNKMVCLTSSLLAEKLQ